MITQTEYRAMQLENNIITLKNEIEDNRRRLNNRVAELNSSFDRRGKFDSCFAVNITSALLWMTEAASKLEVLEEMQRIEKSMQDFAATNNQI